MPCYNSELYISKAIESVLNQSFVDWELLITDDSSNDSSVDICYRYHLLDSRIKIFNNDFYKGAAGARNTSLKFASGRFIAFLDSDDLWCPDKLESQVNFMLENNIVFSFTYHSLIDESGNFLNFFKAPCKVNLSFLRFSNFIPCLTVMYDTSVLGKVYQPNIKKRNDFALWLKILNKTDANYAHCLPKITAKYRVNTYGLSSSRFDTIYFYRKCLIDYGDTSPFKSYIYTCIYILLWFIKSKFSSFYNYFVVKF